MFKNVLSKTIYEKRWTMLLWGLGVAAMAFVMMGFYHSFSGGSFDQVLESVPKSLQGLVGDTASLKTVSGYVAQEAFSLRIPMLTIIMAVILFTGVMAGDENEGTLQTLLAQTVSRTKAFVQKYVASSLVSFVICAGAIVGVWVGLVLIHEQMSFLRLFQAVVGVWLLTMVFGSLGFALSAITGKRGLSGSLVGLLAFGSYLITSFVPNVSWLSSVDKFSPFHYYNHPAITQFGLKGTNTIFMLTVIVLSFAISLFIFRRRDIYQR